MNVNDYIITNSCEEVTVGNTKKGFTYTFGRREPGFYVNQVNFRVVLGIDKNSDFIPSWFNKLRVIKLIDYCIDNYLVDKNQIFYHFSARLNKDYLQLSKIIFSGLSLKELEKLSHILPAEDILEYVKFKATDPYINKSNIVKYDLICYTSWGTHDIK